MSYYPVDDPPRLTVLEAHRRIADALGATLRDGEVRHPGVMEPVRCCWIEGAGWRTTRITHIENPPGPWGLVVTVAGEAWMHSLGMYPKDAAGEVLKGDAYLLDRAQRIRKALEAIGPALRADAEPGQQLGLGL